ncbi:MAG: nucleoside deaminase [Bacillota bacterium]|nr:nucleoside deaminase [Bacillota bacterium]
MDMLDDLFFMKEALKEAKLAFDEGEAPIGAVIVKDGEIIAKTHNHREERHDVSSHAEIEAMRLAGAALGNWKLDGCSLYVTLEPCLMCSGAIVQSRLSRLVYGADDPDKGAVSSNLYIFERFKDESNPLVIKGVMKEECSKLLRDFFSKRR